MPSYNQHTVCQGIPVNVIMGYDVPLQGWFMVVEPLDDDAPGVDPETGLIYSNLDDPDLKGTRGFAQNIDYFKRKLRELKIEMTDLFFGKVEAICD